MKLPSLRHLIADLKARSVPESRRCSFCPREAVAFETNLTSRVETRRCSDHPPDGVTPGACRFCGCGYWPDRIHFDCYSEEPAR